MFNSTGPFYAATVLADNKKAGAHFSACHNTGNLTIVNAGNTENIGIFVGHKADETAIVDESACTNTGVITVNGTEIEAAPAISVDGKRWALPASFSEVVVGVPTAVCFVDMGVTLPGKLIVALDGESAYGADAAGIAMMMQGMMFDYTVEATDASSGKVVIKQVDHFGDAQNVELPYSNLTAESVTVDFTNMLGNMGITVCECTLFTKEVTVQ